MNPNKKEGLMVRLRPEFQKEIFTKLLKQYGFKQGSSLLNKTHGIIYHYRNLRVKYIPSKLIKKVAKLTGFKESQIKMNVLDTITEKKGREESLKIGHKIIKENLKRFRKEIPEVKELVDNNVINVEKWFNKYLKLINFGTRQFKEITVKGNKIKLRYTNYSNGKKKEFVNYLPRKIRLDKDFQYFFGLWCGDRLGSGRFGVVNKNKKINFVTKKHLERLYQSPEFVLIYSQELKEKPKLDYRINKIIKAKSSFDRDGNPIIGYSVSVGIKNRILFSFFDYLLKNIKDLFDVLPNKNIFFAGLFDAEGNVFWEDSCFRWSCKNKELTKIYIKQLKKLNLFNRFDGQNIVTNNLEEFKNNILPFIKHPDKLNKANLLCYNNGYLDSRFLNILKTVKERGGSTNKDLAKVLKRVKLYSQLKFLERFEYIKKEGYPHKNYITMRGLKEIQGGEGSV